MPLQQEKEERVSHPYMDSNGCGFIVHKVNDLMTQVPNDAIKTSEKTKVAEIISSLTQGKNQLLKKATTVFDQGASKEPSV